MNAFAPLPTLSSRPLVWLRARFRASEAWFIALSIVVGARRGPPGGDPGAAGARPAGTALRHHPGGAAERLDRGAADERALAAGRRPRAGRLRLSHQLSEEPADRRPVEANALYGGRMSLRDSLFVGCRPSSNGFGASVGLEAAYAQMGGVAGSLTGRFLNCGATTCASSWAPARAAAIGAAFGAPLDRRLLRLRGGHRLLHDRRCRPGARRVPRRG